LNILDNNLEIKLDKKINSFENKKFGTIFYNGKIQGMVKKTEPIPKTETIDILSKSNTIDELVENIRYIVGKSWFYFKDNNDFYFISTATAAPYFFYKKDNKLYFSHIESHIHSLAAKNNEKINPYELYDLLKLTRKEMTTYGAFFKNVKKIPYGHVLKIDKKHNFLFYSYFTKKDKYSIKRNYHNFKKILESTAKLYADSDQNLYIYLGGIDSLVVCLSVKQFTENIHPVTYHQVGNGSTDGGKFRKLARIYKDAFDVDMDLVFADRYSKKLRKMRDHLCKFNSSNQFRWDSFMYYSIIDKFSNCKNCVFLTGMPFDSIYGINFTKNPFWYINADIGRYFYTKTYQNHLNGFLNKRIRSSFNKKTDLNPKKEYIYSLADPSQYMSHGLPVIKNDAIFSNDDFFNKYLQYKEKNYLISAFNDLSVVDKLNGREINKKFRILRHFQSALLHYRNIASIDNYSRHKTSFFPGEGPLVNFLLDFQLGFKDVFLGKRYLHEYVREKTGKSYTKALIQADNSFKLRILKKFLSFSKKYDFSDIEKDIRGERFTIRNISGCKDKFMFSDVFRSDFFNKVDLDDPTALKYLDNPFLIKYVKEFYSDAKKGLLNFDQICDIYNLEIFLKNLIT